MTAYSYRRYSSHKQDKGTSIVRQTENAEAYCARRGWTLDTSLALTDKAVSAFRGRNAEVGALAEFLKAIKRADVPRGSALIIESVDRLSRDSVNNAQDILRDILRAGITIVTLSPEREYTWESINENPFQLMEIVLYQIRANEESARKSGTAKDRWEKKRAAAGNTPMSAKCPSWLRYDQGRFVVVPESVATVRRIFQCVLDGMGIAAIIKEFTAQKVKPIGRQTKTWHDSYVTKILHNRQVLGEHQPKKQEGKKFVPVGPVQPGYFPAIITPETWHRVQGALASRRPKKGRTGECVANLFSGLLRDARDGESMRVVNKGNKSVKMLVSNGACRGQPGSVYLGFQYRLVELAFLAFVKELKLDLESPIGHAMDLETKQGELVEVTGRLEKVKDRMEREDIDELFSVVASLGKRKKTLEHEIERLNQLMVADANQDLAQVQDVASRLEQASIDGRLGEERLILRNKIRQLVEEIWIYTEAATGNRSPYRQCLISVYFRSGGFRLIYIQTGRDGEMWSFPATADDILAGCPDLRHWRHSAGGTAHPA